MSKKDKPMDSSKKMISVFDTALLLVVGLIGMAGLMGFQNQPADAPNNEKNINKLLEQNKQLENELKSKENEAGELEKQLASVKIDQNIAQSPDSLNSALASVEQIKQDYQKIEPVQKDVNDKLCSAGDTIQKNYKQKQFLKSLKDKIVEFDGSIKKLEIEKTKLEESVNNIDIQKTQSQDILRQIAEQEKTNKSLDEQVMEMEKESKRRQLLWWGNFTGQYILLECNEKGATAYLPDGSTRKIAMEAAEADIDWLKEKIKRTGGVLLAVRTGGFEESYYKISPPIEKLVIEEQKKGNKIEYGFWPVEDNENISNYISRGK
jgi:DNA repair exonuclease SbcCD ATPase subunit